MLRSNSTSSDSMGECAGEQFEASWRRDVWSTLVTFGHFW